MIKRTSYYATLVSLLAASMVGFTSCEDEDNELLLGNWVDTGKDMPGNVRGGAVCFQLSETEVYVGTGANTTKTEDKERYRDFYKCYVTGDVVGSRDKNTGVVNVPISWTERWERNAQGVTSMPDAAPARNGGVGFALKGKGYVGLGFDGKNYLKDMWCFDPKGTPKPEDYPSIPQEIKDKFTATGSWTRIADYPGDSCRYAVAFVIGDYAYVGTGEDYDDNVLSDFYRYDPESNTWTAIPGIGRPRKQATAFTAWCGGKQYGYVVGGRNGGAAVYDFQRYNPESNQWEDLRKIANKTDFDYDDDYTLAAYGATSFVLGNKAYIATGASVSSTACWEYDIENDYWIQKSSFEGGARMFAVSFVLKFGDEYVPFVSTGSTSEMLVTSSGGHFYSDTWMFNPYEWWEDKD